jgi:hypothetical protein
VVQARTAAALGLGLERRGQVARERRGIHGLDVAAGHAQVDSGLLVGDAVHEQPRLVGHLLDRLLDVAGRLVEEGE